MNYSNLELARADQVKREGKSSMVFTSSLKKNKQKLRVSGVNQADAGYFLNPDDEV